MSEIQQAPSNGAPNNGVSTALATTTQKAATPTTTENNSVMNPFAAGVNFDSGQRMALAMSKSNTVPKEYQNNIPAVLMAMDMASRIGTSVLAVMQNLHLIQGRPSWSATFLIGTVNASKRFSPLRFVWEENGEPTKPTNCLKRNETFGCRAVAKDLATGEECIGTLVSWELVRAEKWNSKDGSKWRTPLCEQMFQYRAAAFWSRIYAPDIALGMQTQDETIDTTGYTVSESAAPLRSGSTVDLNAALLAPAVPESGPKAVEHDEDGVVVESEVAS